MSLLWTEYCEDAYANGKTSYMYSQFCDKYRHWARLAKATMRIQHKPGDAMQGDWAGNTIKLYSRYTAETTDVLPSCHVAVRFMLKPEKTLIGSMIIEGVGGFLLCAHGNLSSLFYDCF